MLPVCWKCSARQAVPAEDLLAPDVPPWALLSYLDESHARATTFLVTARQYKYFFGSFTYKQNLISEIKPVIQHNFPIPHLHLNLMCSLTVQSYLRLESAVRQSRGCVQLLLFSHLPFSSSIIHCFLVSSLRPEFGKGRDLQMRKDFMCLVLTFSGMNFFWDTFFVDVLSQLLLWDASEANWGYWFLSWLQR